MAIDYNQGMIPPGANVPQAPMQQQPGMQPPAYGLNAAYNILGQGGSAAGNTGASSRGGSVGMGGLGTGGGGGNSIDANRDLAIQQAQTGIGALSGYNDPGIQAQQLQAALSGTLGADAQAQAYQNFGSSPGQQWLVDQGEQSLMRNQAAMGGLGGGNVMKELAKYGQGMAAQDFQNYYNRIGNVGDRGMQAASLQNSLYNTQSNAATQAGAQHASLDAARAAASASRYGSALNYKSGLQRDAANYAFLAGQGIADNINSNAGDIAGLQNSQGEGISALYGQGAGNISNILIGGGDSQSQSSGDLAALFSNIGMGASSNVSGMPGLPGVSNNPGLIGNAGQFVGGLAQMIPQKD